MHPDFRTDYDVIVVGGGIAGSSVARGLGEKGIRTALVEKKTTPPKKSLFINGDKLFPQRMLDSLAARGALIPCPDFLLVNADHQDRNIEVKQLGENANTHAVFHGPIIEYLQAGFAPSTDVISERVVSSKESARRVEVKLESGSKITAGAVVDATGNYSQLSRIHKVEGVRNILTDDPLVLWVKGVRAYGEFMPGVMLDPIGRDIGLSWVLPYSADYGDIIAADFSKMSEINPAKQAKTLDNLVKFCREQNLCSVRSIETCFSSFIRTQPMPEFAARNTRRLFAVGESAGMASPLMAEVVPAALYWGERLAEFVEKEESPQEFYSAWRRKDQLFPYDLEMAMLRRRMRREAAGEYGSNAPIYQQILSGLPPEIQRQVLTERRIPKKYMLPVLGRVVNDVGFFKNMVELSWELLKVKLDYV